MYQLAERLYNEHAAELVAAPALSLDDREAAADLTHEVFLQAMVKEHQLREHPNPRAWLFRTGYNLARNRLALLLRRGRIGREHGTRLDLDSWDAAIDLRASLQRLSRRQRDAVILHHYFGFSVLNVAGMMGCSEGAVLSHLHRGRRSLSRLLGGEEVAP